MTTDSLDNYDIVLYHAFPSRSTRIKWLIIELGLDEVIQTKYIELMKGEHKQPEFLKMNPMGAIPLLQLTSKQNQHQQPLYMTESAGILSFLMSQQPHDQLLQPEINNIPAMAIYHRVIAFTSSSIDSILWDIRRHEQLYPKEKRLQIVADNARKAYQDTVVPTIEQLLCHTDGMNFVCAPFHNHFTAADIMLAYSIFWADLYQLNSPIMRNYMKIMTSRPAFIKLMQDAPTTLIPKHS